LDDDGVLAVDIQEISEITETNPLLSRSIAVPCVGRCKQKGPKNIAF